MSGPGQDDPRPVGEILPALLRSMRTARGAGVATVQPAWRRLVGEATAARTRLAGLKDGVLTVEVESAALKHDLATFRREALLRGMRQEAPRITLREIRFRVGRVP